MKNYKVKIQQVIRKIISNVRIDRELLLSVYKRMDKSILKSNRSIIRQKADITERVKERWSKV